jgi:hypothetical protein
MRSQTRLLIAAGFAMAFGTAALGTSANAEPGTSRVVPTVTYDAVVTKFGQLRSRRSSGATSAQLVSRGTYLVDFGADLTTCTIVATVGRGTIGGPFWKPAFITASVAQGDPNGVLVLTHGLRNRLRDYPFHLIIGC